MNTMGFDALKADNLSGASQVLTNTAEYWLEEIQSMQPSSLRRGLTTIRHRGLFIIRLYPRMAPLFHLVNNVLLSCAKATSVDELIFYAGESINHTVNKMGNNISLLLPAARKIIKTETTIFVYSRSHVVLSILKKLNKLGVTINVIVTEGRPMNEGQRVAEELLAANMAVTFMVDAAMQQAVNTCDFVMIGADTFSEKRVVNKIGTHAVALLARELKKPIYCLATSDKYLPPTLNQLHEKDHSGSEVWPGAPKRLQIKNKYFENTPIELITDVITELGPFKPAALSVLLDLPVDEWLRDQF